ncbi:aminoacyl-tRNA hydrolase, partial [Pseudokineococcus sp. 5B2Z-1]|uniref:aminoacyl-tRNA hydrolase n=1 Tax=Pseudokineococcus sp. 5B2Z-1 TaxID=3132744 RepID=UPI0030AF92EA
PPPPPPPAAASPTGGADDGPWLVVGLGNPGPEYAATRHNVGQMVLDVLAARTGAGFRSHKARAAVAQARLGALPGGRPGPAVVLAKPSTYMNVSGGPVAGLARFFSVPAERVVVVHDELDLPGDVVRLKRGGGEGGHNGLRDTSKALGTKDYVRVRVGIGRPPGRMDPADFVLKPFGSAERRDLPVLLEEAADAVELVVLRGLEAAQQQVHAPR